MIELLLSGVGILAIMATWKFVWLPTVLDTTRDALFDLRDRKLRRYFLAKGVGLDHPVYAKLRHLLNGHLRYTKSLSLSQFVYIQMQIDKDKEAAAARFAEFDRKFKVDDPELQKFVDRIRLESSVAMLSYMVSSSPISLAFAQLYRLTLVIRHMTLKDMFATTPAVRARSMLEQCALA